MRVLRVAALLSGSLRVLAGAEDDWDGSVTTARANAPAYLVGANVYSTSTLYTTSYYVITECAPYASDCPTNALTVVTSVVFASSTTTVCLTTELPQAAQPPFTGTVPAYTSIDTSKPTGSDTAPSPGGSSIFPSGQLSAIPSFGIPIGPGPEITTRPSSSPPYGSITGAPVESNSGYPSAPTPSNVLTSLPGTAGPSSPAPGNSNNQSYGPTSLTVTAISSSPALSVPSVVFPGASSYNAIPGVPPRPHPSSDSSSTPLYSVSSAPRPSAGPSISRPDTISNSDSSGAFPTLTTPTWNLSATRPYLSSGNPTLSSGPGASAPPYMSVPSSLSPAESRSAGASTTSITGTTGLSSLWTGSVPISGSGAPTDTVSFVPISEVSSGSSPIVTPNIPETSSLVRSSPYVASPTGSDISAPRTTTSSAIEGTTTTQLTSIITLPHTTFVYTVPAQTSGRNYSTETLGIHTSIGTDASAYIPTGTGSWPSATNNGTVNSPTPTSPMPVNNEGSQTFASGKSAFIAIVGALAFAHFAHIA